MVGPQALSRLVVPCLILACRLAGEGGGGPARSTSASAVRDGGDGRDGSGAVETRAPASHAEAPDAGMAAGPDRPALASPYDGVYVGPSEAYVWVLEGAVREIQLLYAGNAGFTFAGARVRYVGNWPVRNGSFTVETNAVLLRGSFVRPGRIDGTWQDGQVRGTWNASRVADDPSGTDAGRCCG